MCRKEVAKKEPLAPTAPVSGVSSLTPPSHHTPRIPYPHADVAWLPLELMPFGLLSVTAWALHSWMPAHVWVAYVVSALGALLYTYGKLSVVPPVPLPINTDPALTYREQGDTVLVPRRYPSPSEREGKPVRKVTMAEVRRHNTASDLWIAIEGYAYDVTPYLQRHPGGPLALIHVRLLCPLHTLLHAS